MTLVRWPDNKRFAFTVFDDTDKAGMSDVPLVYGFLAEQGLRTTKSVWVLDSGSDAVYPGLTCEDERCREWLLELEGRGFEIGLHNVAASSSRRERTLEGLDRFREYFGHDPSVHANHVSNLENIYWGVKRLSDPMARLAYRLATLGKQRRYYGDDEESPYFWGDLCRERIRYVRNLVFRDIDTLRACPQMPYHDPAKPYVHHWFAASDGGNIDSFLRLMSRVDDLEESGGACIVYTHFANGFVRDGRLHPGFRRVIEDLARRPGWFVPVGTLLDWLRKRNAAEAGAARPRWRRMEYRWLLQRAVGGGTH